MNQNKINLKQALLFSTLYAITVITICCLFQNDFFCVDDAEFEMLGFFRQMGHIWSQGKIPLIVDSMYFGGNEVIDLDRGIFLPQNILVSLITSKFDDIQLPGRVLAFINIVLVCLSSLSIAKTFKLQNCYAYAFASLVVIQPIFLYQYLGAWWNAASGQAWAMVSIATFLLLLNHFSKTNIVLNFISVIFLLAAGWPHGVIGYVVFVVVSVAYQLKQPNGLHKAFYLSLPTILAFIFAFPIYSEYIFSHELINRVSGFDNQNKAFIPSWATIIMGFFPTFYDYMTYFSYKLILIPLGFSTLFVPIVFFYYNVKSLWQKNDNLKIFLTLMIAFFVLSQMPSQFGPFRWPFRFLPFLSLFECLAVFYILQFAQGINENGIKLNKKISFVLYIILGCFFLGLPFYAGFDTFALILCFILILFLLERDSFFLNKSILANLNKKYLCFILLSSIFVFFNSWNLHPIFVVLQIFSIWLLLLSPMFIKRKSSFSMVGLSLLILLIILNGLPTLGGYYSRHTDLAEQISLPKNVNLEGYVLSLPDNTNLKQIRQFNDIASALFGFYGIKSINGYTPVGNKRLDKILPANQTSHGIFKPEMSLKNILQLSDKSHVCQAELMRISTIIVDEAKYSAFSSQFKQCGYTVVQFAGSRHDLYVSLPLDKTIGWNRNSPFVFPNIAGVNVLSHQNNIDLIRIPEHKEVLTLIFPRLWWFGYTAKINDHSLPVVADDSGSLVQVSVPPQWNGVLKLSYFPITWRYVWFLPLVAMFALILLLIFNRDMKFR